MNDTGNSNSTTSPPTTSSPINNITDTIESDIVNQVDTYLWEFLWDLANYIQSNEPLFIGVTVAIIVLLLGLCILCCWCCDCCCSCCRHHHPPPSKCEYKPVSTRENAYPIDSDIHNSTKFD